LNLSRDTFDPAKHSTGRNVQQPGYASYAAAFFYMINNIAADSRMICIICIGVHLGNFADFAPVSLSAYHQTMFDYWPGTMVAKNITHTFDTLGHLSGSYVARIGLKQSG
jgi:hypothetical protein